MFATDIQALMGEKKMSDTSINMQKKESNGYPCVTIPAMRNFVMQVPEKLQKSLKVSPFFLKPVSFIDVFATRVSKRWFFFIGSRILRV